METFTPLFCALCLLLCLAACREPSPDLVEEPLRILPLGDSRVEGEAGYHESYRYELWKRLVEAGWNVDFMGSRQNPRTYPTLSDLTFDGDHEGTDGATTEDNLWVVQHVEFATPPDVVLLGIGINDLARGRDVSEAIADLGLIIQELQGLNPQVTLLVEQIAPVRSDFTTPAAIVWLDDYNGQIPGLADSHTTASSSVVVDMYTDWLDAYMPDDVHYNEAGGAEVARRYFEVMLENVPQQ